MDKRILVLGASGLVGSALMRGFERKSDVKVVGTYCSHSVEDCAYVDMRDPQSINKMLTSFRPNDIYIPAAITNVDHCETGSDARKVNVEAVDYVVRYSTAYPCCIIFFSSSFVFDGRLVGRSYSTYDRPMPLNEYGMQKLLAERAVLGGVNNIVVRTVGVFGPEDGRKNFAYQVIDGINLGKSIPVANDQYINPILADDLAQSTIKAAEMGFVGVLHIAGTDTVSKYEFALDLARQFDLPTAQIKEVTSKEMGRMANRPRNGCLMNSIKPEYDYTKSLERFRDNF